MSVTRKVWPGMWSVFHLLAGQVPGADRAIEEIGRFSTEDLTPDSRIGGAAAMNSRRPPSRPRSRRCLAHPFG